MTWCSVSLEDLPDSVVGLPIVKVPGSTQIISRSEADETVQDLGGLLESKDEPLFEPEELSLELFESWFCESYSVEATGATHWSVCLI